MTEREPRTRGYGYWVRNIPFSFVVASLVLLERSDRIEGS
jgi:hypothetical protein